MNDRIVDGDCGVQDGDVSHGSRGSRGFRGGRERRLAAWRDWPAAVAAVAYTTTDGRALGYSGANELSVWIASRQDGGGVLTCHPVRVERPTGEACVLPAIKTWRPGVAGWDRFADATSIQVAATLVGGLRTAVVNVVPVVPQPLFGYIRKPIPRDTPQFRRFVAAECDVAAEDLNKEALAIAWNAIARRVRGRPGLWFYPALFAVDNLLFPLDVHPVNGTERPVHVPGPGDFFAGWVECRGRWVAAVERYSTVIFDMSSVMGVGGHPNPTLKVLGSAKGGMGLFVEPRSALRNDPAARRRYAAFVESLLDRRNTAFSSVFQEVARRVPAGVRAADDDIIAALVNPLDDLFVRRAIRPSYFESRNVVMSGSRWSFASAFPQLTADASPSKIDADVVEAVNADVVEVVNANITVTC